MSDLRRGHRLLAVTTMLSLVAVLAGGAEAVHASGDALSACKDADGQLVLREQQSWFKDRGTKVGNVGRVLGELPTWEDQPPSGTVGSGAGGGYAATGSGASWVHFEGSFQGCVDRVAVELYFLDTRPASNAPLEILPQVAIDGHCVYQGLSKPVVTEANPNAQATGRIRFALKDLTELAGVLAAKDIDVAGTHQVRVSLRLSRVADGAAGFVYDTTEVPSNLTFNGNLDGYTTFKSFPLLPLPDGIDATQCYA